MATINFTLTPRPPFRLDLTAWTLRRRSHNEIDRWDGETYSRVLVLREEPVLLHVCQQGDPGTPELLVTASSHHLPPDVVFSVSAALRLLLGLDVDLAGFYQLADGDDRLGTLVERFRGVKPPRYPTTFEALINGILSQQLTLTVGINLMNRLAGACGMTWHDGSQSLTAFPEPPDVAELPVEMLRQMQLSEQRANAVIGVAQATANGDLDLPALEEQDNESAIRSLSAMRGVGRWTSEYVLLRGLGRLNVFPGEDSGARGSLERWLELPSGLSYSGLTQILARWQPYSGMIYFHLLLAGLAQAGHVQ